MTLEKINTVYFLGIGGIGMSALARFFLLQGKQVHGYDLTPTELTSQLISEGAHIHFDEDLRRIPPQVDVAIFTPAIPKKHKEYLYFIENEIPLLKRSEILGIICAEYPTIAVAGTHGKTTTTAMITQMMVKRDSLYKILSFIGGISKNINTNFFCDPNFNTIIAEADEFDRSFLTLYPQVAIITSIDADHLDIYGDHDHLKASFQLFANQIQPTGTLVVFDEIADKIEHPNKVCYGFSENADYRISEIQYYATKTVLHLTSLFSNLTPLTINLPGKHNALNAVAAFAASLEFLFWKNNGSVNSHIIKTLEKQLADFSGVKRRFDIRIQRDDFVYIDDYAHHPEEIRAFLDAVKKSYPTKKITGIFQPHLYSRTRDFALEFAEALEVLDEIILLDIYPAREMPIEGITSNYLLSLIKNTNKKLFDREKLVPYLQEHKPEVLLTMGAGDIDRLVGVLELIS